MQLNECTEGCLRTGRKLAVELLVGRTWPSLSAMKLTAHLADAAQPDLAGKVSALGLGWTYIGTPMPPHAIVLFIEVEPSEANVEHRLTCDLLDEDGQQVAVNGEPVLHFDGELTVGAGPDAVPGAAITQAFAFPIPAGIPLPAGRRWEYRLTVGYAVASASFATRAD